MWRASLVLLTIAIPAIADAQTETGTMNLHLGIPLGTILLESSVEISNPSIGFSEVVQEPRGPGEFAVTGLPPANGYTVYVVSRSTNGSLCSGFDDGFPIAANTTTIVFANLTCVPLSALPAPALGAFAPLLGLLLASLGALALRARSRRVPGPIT